MTNSANIVRRGPDDRAPLTELELEIIWSKPGKQWSEEEKDRVEVWLWEPAQRKRWLYIATSFLGNPDDAEDAVIEFFLGDPPKNCSLQRNADKVIHDYDPEKGKRFPSWYIYHLRFFCIDTYHKIARTSPEPLGPTLENPNGNTSGEAIRNIEYEHLKICLSILSADSRELFMLKEYEGYSYLEIAISLGLESDTKTLKGLAVQNFRVKGALRSCLTKRWRSRR